MKIIRITTKQKPVLKYLEEAWIAPDEQDVLTEDIIKWLRMNIHRADVGLFVIIDEGHIVGCLLALGPSLLLSSVHIYTAWIKKGTKIDSREFFGGEFTEWCRSLGAEDITICSAGHTGRAWQRRFGFVPYTRMYIRRLESVPTPMENLSFLTKELKQ